jgi:hypothetical protein
MSDERQRLGQQILSHTSMKITVAFYGIPRCTAISAPSIERHVLAPLRRIGQVTVVHHLWKIDGIKSIRSGENGKLPPDAYDYFKHCEGLVEPAPPFESGELFARWKWFGDAFGDDFASLRNLMHQLQSLHRVTELVSNTAPDVVIFARPDLLYHDAIPESAVRLAENRPKLTVIPIWNWWGGFNDRFAICGREAYEAYGRRLELGVSFAEQNRRPVHSESLVKFALHEAGVETLGIPLKASRVRLDGSVKVEDFDHLRTNTPWYDPLGTIRMLAAQRASKRLFPDAFLTDV